MKREDLAASQTRTILFGAALMLTLSMGMRQSLGLFQPHLVRDIGITAAEFSLAIALQNAVWGLTQPFAGACVDRYGTRPVAVFGAAVYLLGMLLAITAQSALMITLGLGVCVGLALSCTATNVAMNIASRTVSPARRSVAMGFVSALGSLGLMVVSPSAQAMIVSSGWVAAMMLFAALACVMVPAAFLGGAADRIELDAGAQSRQSMGDAVREAVSHRGYLVMTTAYFVCGLQLVFVTTHLPNYLDTCGIGPEVTASALALIGLFNAIGSWVFGWLGGRYPRQRVLGGLYLARSLVFTAYFMVPPTPTTTLLFAAVLGSLWLGVVPLVNGLVIQLFGMRYLATLTGISFLSHQLGSFLGAWGGGLIYSAFGSYEWAWKSAVLIGLLAGLLQMTMDVRPADRLRAAAAV